MSGYSKFTDSPTSKTKTYIKAVLSLFKAVPTFAKVFSAKNFSALNQDNIAKGFFITESAFNACPYVTSQEILNFIAEKFGYDIFQLNRGFYKSFQTVTELSPEQILINKISHYITTYGFKESGIFNHDTVFIPNGELELPEDSTPVKLTIIDSLSDEEIKSRAEKLIMAGIALSNETLENLMTIIDYLKIDLQIDDVPNKELRIHLCEILGLLPKNPAEFLRYLIYKVSGATLLIKSPEVIHCVKWTALHGNTDFDKYFAAYIRENGIAKLAEVFHRYKPLWLAFKPYSKFMKSTVNKMRKLADTYHKPIKPKILDTVTSNAQIDIDELKRELEKISVFKRISLANAILFRMSTPESIAYMIRNGKVFVEEYAPKFAQNYKILSAVIDSIVDVVRPNVAGKKIFLPEILDYAAPTSEKKFIGAIPYGTSYAFESKSVVVGVHWFNLRGETVDLDLHLNSTKRDIGWDNDFNRENFIDTKTARVIFSGDMTDAPIDEGGATEAYFVGESIAEEMMMINLNRYTYHEKSIPFKIFLGNVEQARIDKKYLIDAHEISFCLPNEINSGEMFIGFLDSDADGNKKFYFTAASKGSRIVARSDRNSARMISALRSSLQTSLRLKNILQYAGAIFEKEDGEEWDINLDAQILTKDSILSLFEKGE